MFFSCKVLLDPTPDHAAWFAKVRNVAHLAYATTLRNYRSFVTTGVFPNEGELMDAFHDFMDERSPYTCLPAPVVKRAATKAVRDARKAILSHYSGRRRRAPTSHNFCGSVRIDHGRDAGSPDADVIHLVGQCVEVPGIGFVHMAAYPRIHRRIVAAKIKQIDGKWFMYFEYVSRCHEAIAA